MPAPSVPGSQAATTASAVGRIRSTITGRPDRMTTTSRSTIGRTRSIVARSASGSASVAESPTPSAYGGSATTTIPVSAWVPSGIARAPA